MIKKAPSAEKVLKTSFLVDLLDISLNLIVALLTGSIVMVAETIQGFADAISDIFLIIGVNASKKINKAKHAFGYGKSIYFWVFVAGIIILSITSVITFYVGLVRFFNPEVIENVFLAYIVLSISIVSNGYSFSLGFRRIIQKERLKNFLRVYRESQMVEIKTTFVLDFIGVAVAVIGLVSLAIYGFSGDARFDGIGAMIIAVLLAIMALSILKRTHELIIGARAPKSIEEKIKKAALSVKNVRHVLGLKTMNIGIKKLLVAIDIHVNRNLKTRQIELLTDEVKSVIKKKVPEAYHIQVEIETPKH
ncbi:MAG: cation diffusion facilitator family transporter [Candidatus Nanoarchaeia archaeon]|nr:cation diffusion facilitator family transporter [Candidatus Nanoarchaeia archaeon]